MASTPVPGGPELGDAELEEKWNESMEDIKAIDPGE